MKKNTKIYIRKKSKNNILKNKIRARKGCWNWLRRFKNAKRLKFDNIFLTDGNPVDKENSS
jgi:hypothetical protein